MVTPILIEQIPQLCYITYKSFTGQIKELSFCPSIRPSVCLQHVLPVDGMACHSVDVRTKLIQQRVKMARNLHQQCLGQYKTKNGQYNVQTLQSRNKTNYIQDNVQTLQSKYNTKYRQYKIQTIQNTDKTTPQPQCLQ